MPIPTRHNFGTAYIFQRDDDGVASWSELKPLIARNAGPDDAFGYSVAISEDFAVVSAVNDGDKCNDSASD